MAMYVYKDKERNEKLYANNASKEDKGIRFYCPNPKCDAHMYICSVDGFSSAHFKAKYKQYQHVANCPFHFQMVLIQMSMMRMLLILKMR